MIDLASRIIGRILFGADMTGTLSQIMHFSYVNDLLRKRGIAPHNPPMWVPTPNNRRLSAGLGGLRGLVADIVAQRRAKQSDAPVNDMLGLLLAARDDENPGHRLTDTEVADQVLIFLLAGHETTATTLACGLVEVARSPLWQSMVQDELREVLGERAPTGADVPALHRTGWVVRESMRLYPPAHSIGRRAGVDDVVCGYRIPAGGIVVISPWSVHRSPQVWSDPDTFDPSRFDIAHGDLPGGHRYAWFPFGAGPHTCVGMQLALMEAPLVLATILQEFRVTTQIDSIPVRAAVTLRPAIPLPVKLDPPDPVPTDALERRAESPSP
jgi:cytochrome P450